LEVLSKEYADVVGEDLTVEERKVKYVGKRDPKRHLEEVGGKNTLGVLVSSVVF
jgi:hypothetical protein